MRNTISGGGSASENLSAAIGQSSPVRSSSTGPIIIRSGFWVSNDLMPNIAYSAKLNGLDSYNDNLTSRARGVAWTDIDKDGDWDIYVTRGFGSTVHDYVFINNFSSGQFTFTESSQSKLASADGVAGAGVSFADYDGDGDLDGFVQNDDGSAFLWRNGGASFSNVFLAEGLVTVDSKMPSWGDYDGDGLVDLFLASESGGMPGLFSNTGNYAPSAQGFLQNTSSLAFATTGVGSWLDFDNDGKLDLYIAQEPGTDLLYRNDGDGQFTDISEISGISSIDRDTKGVAFGDYDKDGYLDIYVTCAGNDILWHNNGNGTFSSLNSPEKPDDSRAGRSCMWLDVDNDGDMDIYVANDDGPDFLHRNNGDGTFTRLNAGDSSPSYGCAAADYDNDGDLDVLVTGDRDHFTLYENQAPNKNHIVVRPTDSLGNWNCYGAQVVLRYHSTPTIYGAMQIDGGSGRGCQSAYGAHFGVPDGSTKFDIEVRYTRQNGGQQLVIDSTTNPDLAGISASDLDNGVLEVRENGRILLSHGIAYVRDAHVYLIAKAGGTPTQLTADVEADSSPSWAPDGQKLVFVRDRNVGPGQYRNELFTMAADGSRVTSLFTPEWSSSQETDPAWSSDGTQIAFVTNEDGDKEIQVTNSAGTEFRKLTDNAASDQDPAWNAVNTKIAFVSDRDGTDKDVYSMNFDGSDVVPLSDASGDNSANDIEPCWHPNGLYLAFASDRIGGTYQIYVMQFDGTAQTATTSGGAAKRNPAFTNDGKQIIYETSGTLHIMDFPSGANDVELTDAGPNSTEPSYPLLFRKPPKTVVFGTRDGRTYYWGDPVNAELGNYTRNDVDFMFAGFGDPLVWGRTYNSQDTMAGPLGYGWRFSYQITITEDADESLTVTWGDGRQDFFVKNLQGNYAPLEDRTTHTIVKNGDDSYTLITRERTVFEFFPVGAHAKNYDPNAVGKVKSIADKNGNAFQFTYDANGLLTDVTQGNGRNLKVVWENAPTYGDRIKRVEENISGVTTPRRVRYSYDANGNLDKVTQKDDVRYTKFAYDANHRLVEIKSLFDIPASGPNIERTILTNVYNEDGRVEDQYDGNGNHSSLAYTQTGDNLETTATDARGKTQKQIFDKFRRLIEHQDQAGNSLQYRYDQNGYKTHIVDRDGKTFRFPETPEGQPTGMTDPLDNRTKVAYDPDGTPTSRTVTPESGVERTISYTYDANGNLASVTDPVNASSETEYNANGKPIKVTNEFGKATTLVYEAATGDLTHITNSLGHDTEMRYDARGRLRRVIDPLSNEAIYTYNADDQLSTITDANQNVTTFSYYAGGALKSVQNELGDTASFEYDDNLNVSKATDPRGHATDYEYDGNNNVVRISDTYQGQPREINYTYDDLNRLITLSDAEGNAVHYNYDKHGRITKFTDARGQDFFKEYDAAGRVTHSYTVLDGQTIENFYEYNGVGELTKVTDPLGNATRFRYDELGRLTKTIYEGGRSTETEYYTGAGPGAFYGAVEKFTNINGRDMEYEYDDIGRLVMLRDNIGRETAYSYDDAGRVIEIDDGTPSEPRKTQYVYDRNGNLTRRIDATGDAFDIDYDELNRPTKVYLPYPNGGARGKFVLYTYGATGATRGRLVSITDPDSHTTSFEYDEDGRTIKTTDAEGNVSENTYDRIGRLTKTKAGVGTPDESETQYVYDPNGNLITLTKIMSNPPADSQVHQFEYDGLNRMVKYTDPVNRETSREFNAVGLLTKLTVPNTAMTTFVTQYTYDELYRLVHVDYPDGTYSDYTFDDLNGHPRNLIRSDKHIGLNSETLEWTYDSADRVATIKDVWGKQIGYTYDHFDRVHELIYPNGQPVTYTYNNRDQITRVEDWLGNYANYEYDAQQRCSKQTNSNGTYTEYSYYDNGWLKTLANKGPGNTTISNYSINVDALGNRTSIDRNEPTLPFPSTEVTNGMFDKANQIQSDGQATYAFDQRGNLTQENRGSNTVDYYYDYANRLTGVVSDTPAIYSYDDQGSRTRAVRNGQETRFTIDPRGMGWMIAENDSSNNSEWYYIHANGLTWRVNAASNQINFYHGDHATSVTSLTDSGGVPIQGYTYDTFGKTLRRLDEDLVQPFQYSGGLGVEDEPNSLQFMRARFHHSTLGRFLSADPVFTTQPYAYALNSPLTMHDSDGRFAASIGGVLGVTYGAILADIDHIQENGTSGAIDVASNIVLGELFAATRAIQYGDEYQIRRLESMAKYGRAFYDIGDVYGKVNTVIGAASAAASIQAGTVSASAAASTILLPLAVTAVAGWPVDKIFGENYVGLFEDLALVSSQSHPEYSTYETEDPGPKPQNADVPIASIASVEKQIDPEVMKQAIWQSHVDAYQKQQLAKAEARYMREGGADGRARTRLLKQWAQREADVQTQMDAFMGDLSWDSFSGGHGVTYTYVSDYGINRSFMTGWWYSNVARIAGAAIPGAVDEAAQKAMSAQASAVRSVRLAVSGNFGANGRNTPFIPEIYEMELIEGKMQAFRK